MAVLPTRLVEIELTPGSGTWTDVSADVVSVSTKRGRNRELGSFETGTMVVVLRNETRNYDPEYAAGPYYGNLRPNRRIRLRATYNAVTYPVFQGYVDQIGQEYQGPNGAVTTISASDLFKILNRAELPPSVYAAEVSADVPDIWYRLGDPGLAVNSTAYNTGTLGQTYSGTYGPTSLTNSAVPVSVTGLIVRDPDGAVQMTVTGDVHLVTPRAFGFDQSPFAIEFWVRIDAYGTFFAFFEQPANVPGGLNWYSQVLGSGVDTGRLQFVGINDAGTEYAVATPGALNIGQTYHVVLVHDAGRQLRIYLDGVETWTAYGGFTTVTTGTMTPWAQTLWLITGTGSNVTVDELAVYRAVVPSAARIAAHTSAGKTPWRGDLPGTRIGRILDLAGIAAADRQIDTGSTTLQSSSLS